MRRCSKFHIQQHNQKFILSLSSFPFVSPLHKTFEKKFSSKTSQRPRRIPESLIPLFPPRSNDIILGAEERLLAKLSRQGQSEEAGELVDRLKSEGFKLTPVHYGMFMSSFAKEGKDYYSMKAILKQMRDDGVKPILGTYTTLLYGIRGNKNMSDFQKIIEVKAVFEEMEEEGVQPELLQYTLYILLLVQAKRLRDCERLIKVMTSKHNIQPDIVIFNLWAEGYLNIRQPKKAIEIFHNYVVKNGLEPQTATYLTMIGAFKQLGEPDKGRQLLRSIEKDGIQPDVTLFNAVMNSFAEACDLDRVLEIFEEMKSSEVPPTTHTYNTLIKAYRYAGQLAKARDILKIMEEDGKDPDIVSYGGLIQSYSSKGRMTEVNELVDEMMQKGIQPDHLVQNCIERATSR